MPRSKPLLAGFALIAAVTLAATAQAGFGGAAAPTKFAAFRYDKSHRVFKGRIGSPDPRCVDGRKVSAVFQTKRLGTELVLGHDRAGANGEFKIKMPGGPPRKGKYYGYAGGRDKHCNAGFSEKIRLKPER